MSVRYMPAGPHRGFWHYICDHRRVCGQKHPFRYYDSEGAAVNAEVAHYDAVRLLNDKENPVNESSNFDDLKVNKGDRISRRLTYRYVTGGEETWTKVFTFSHRNGDHVYGQEKGIGPLHVTPVSSESTEVDLTWSIVKRAERTEPPYGTVVPYRNDYWEGFYIRTANGWDVFERSLKERRTNDGYGYTKDMSWSWVRDNAAVLWDEMKVPG